MWGSEASMWGSEARMWGSEDESLTTWVRKLKCGVGPPSLIQLNFNEITFFGFDPIFVLIHTRKCFTFCEN